MNADLPLADDGSLIIRYPMAVTIPTVGWPDTPLHPKEDTDER
jgi:hypothetical protein